MSLFIQPDKKDEGQILSYLTLDHIKEALLEIETERQLTEEEIKDIAVRYVRSQGDVDLDLLDSIVFDVLHEKQFLPRVGYNVTGWTVFRYPTGSPQRSAYEIIEYEKDELGNYQQFHEAIEVAAEKDIDLEAYNGIWVCWTREQAAVYSRELIEDQLTEHPELVEELVLPKGSIVISDLGEEGALIAWPKENIKETA